MLRNIILKPGAPDRPLAVAAKMAFTRVKARSRHPKRRTERSHHRNSKRRPRASKTPECTTSLARIRVNVDKVSLVDAKVAWYAYPYPRHIALVVRRAVACQSYECPRFSE